MFLCSLFVVAQAPASDSYQPIDVARVDSLNRLAVQADAAYNRQEFAKAAELYAQAFDRGFDLPEIAYSTASCYARAGDKDKAFAYLDCAVAMGYTAADQAKNDPDLATLHGDPRWQPLLAALEGNQRESEEQQAKIWDTPAIDTPFRPTLTDQEKIAGLSKFWAEVKYNFVYPGRLAQLNWDNLYLAYIPKVLATKSTYDYYRVLQELCAKLHDAHTNVYPAPELLGSVGLHTRLIEARLMVLEAWDPELRSQGIEPGMEIVSIDGLTPRDYVARNVAPYQSSSTPQDLDVRSYEYFLFQGAPGQTIRVTFQTASGRSITRTLRRKPYKELGPLHPKPPRFSFRVLPGNIGYVALNSLEDTSVAEQFLADFNKIAKTSALILDLRENGGGNSGVGMTILATLLDKPVALAPWQTRDYKPIFRAWGRPIVMPPMPGGDLSPDPAHHYSNPVIVLISPRTFSSAEDFLVAYDQSGRGSIVGEPSAGSTGQPLSFKMPGGGSARVCTWRGVYPDGRPFIGVGVQPRVRVAPRVAEFRAGKDIVLETALAELKQEEAKP